MSCHAGMSTLGKIEGSGYHKHREVEKMFPCESSTEPKYQLRRTSSVTF
ncbi:hypothetical protein CK203_104743 [Vitis vinifera]|uniref:Uncharacterized protein n=1 Tax=Vitis vinifera TaxID=29760 RepID=A0A438E2B2_VITVI|nr:hypothetical protein CK203_104743 [Vitis vinifera]